AVLRDALSIHRRISDRRRSPALAWTLDELGAILRERGHFAEAEDLVREALSIKQRVFGDMNPNTVGTLNLLIAVLQEEGKPGEVEKLRREAGDLVHEAPRTRPTTREN